MAATPASTPDLAPPRRTTILIVLLCWAAILTEGYDVGVMGAIVPTLLADKGWRLTPVEIGTLGSLALAGMFLGAMIIGTLSDLYGRRRMFIGCIALFSLSMIAASLAPSPFLFGLARLIGGLGLGGIIPVAAAYTIEFSPVDRRGINYGLMYSGYSLGILAAALVAIATIEATGWRGVVGVGAFGLILVPIALVLLPESIDFLVARGRMAEAQALARRLGCAPPVARQETARPVASARTMAGEIFSGSNGVATILFWIAIAMGLLNVYGLNTWLPQIMRKAGYDLGSSLSFLAVFSLASAIGGVLIGRLADGFGKARTVAISFVLGAVGIAALTLKGGLIANYALIAVAGLGSISASLVLTAYIAEYYTPGVRTTATGWAMSAGRIGAMSGPLVGGYIASLQLDASMNFIIFAGVALVAAIATALVPGRKAAV